MRMAPSILSTAERYLGRPVRSVLEIGCGSGFLGKAMEQNGVTYVGTEIDRNLLRFAEGNSLNVHDLSAEVLGTELDSKFDLVLSSNVFEHVQDPVIAFKSANSVCQGILIVIVPNALGLYQRLRANHLLRRLAQAFLGVKQDRAYTLDGYWHNIAYCKETLQYLCRQASLRPIVLSSMSINDPTFGFVQPNLSLKYRFAERIAALLRMESELLLIANSRVAEA